jgi:lantibiotic transport system permease protein
MVCAEYEREANERRGDAMIFKLFWVELIKIRRSLAILMMLVCPLMVVLLTSGIQSRGAHRMTWAIFWANNTAMWAYFMLPLYIALITALLNGSEHKNATWRLMLTLPISARQLYLSKIIVAWIFVFGANVLLIGLVYLSISLFGLAGVNIENAFHYAVITNLWKITLCCLPMLVVQHWVSWRFQNIVAPLAVGVIATMGIMQIGSSKEWIYYPWSYVMMAVHGSSDSKQQLAIILASVVACILLFCSSVWIGRKSAEFQ